MRKDSIYDHQKVEAKWQRIWEREKIFEPDLDHAQKPFYNLMMYPYPSGEGLHVGNLYAFTGADIYGRFMRMKGYDVFEPIGVDSGGLHSENYAIKVGGHPKKVVAKNVKHFVEQLHKIGAMFDWRQFVDVMSPDYYKWTQWLFVQLFKAGLAYKKEAPVIWCPSCKTTLSDEQTEKQINRERSLQEEMTVCERCKTPIEKRKMKQWFFKITDYAERLLANTKKLNWTEKVLLAQQNWIGKSEGAEIRFKIHDSKVKDKKIKVFTTRPDTLFGCTFFCLAPEHPLVTQITTKENKKRVEQYIKRALNKTEQDRKTEEKDKTGIFTGSYVVNPVNQEKVPVWVADYVLMDYEGGAVMGVPGHDKRDFIFAKKYHLPIKTVVVPNQKGQDAKKEDCYEGEGILVNSREWNGWRYPDDLDKVIAFLARKKVGRRMITYKLRDWCISRQRYWGPPIPMIYCPWCAEKGWSHFTQRVKCQVPSRGAGRQSAKLQLKTDDGEDPSSQDAGWYPVPEDDLPVLLPDIEDYLPDGSGKAPLARHPEFYQTQCPHCGRGAQRETDVSDTFLDSSWYFLAYPNVGTDQYKKGPSLQQGRVFPSPFNKQRSKKWLPVDQYTGGAEHSVLHLLYSRFITMTLHDMGYLNFSGRGGLVSAKAGLEGEPFSNFYAHGLLIKDGAKMSKSRGNVVNPDEYIAKYGADSLRLYLMFMGPLSAGGDFRDEGMQGMHRFVKRVYRLAQDSLNNNLQNEDPELMKALAKLTHKMGEDISRFKYNTAIAKLMEFCNLWVVKADKTGPELAERVALLLAPLAPHLAEEIWQVARNKRQVTSDNDDFDSVHCQCWPQIDEKQIKEEMATLILQVNGKVRDKIQVPAKELSGRDKKLEMVGLAKRSEKLQKFIGARKVHRIIFVPGRLLNFVV